MPSDYPEHFAAYPWRLRIDAAPIWQIHSLARCLLTHWAAATAGFLLSLSAKLAYNQGQVQKASASSNGILINCKHTPLMGGSHSNWLDCDWQSHAKPCKQCTTVVFKFADRLSISGWIAVDRWCFICRILTTPPLYTAVKCTLRSDKTSGGTPCSRTTWWMTICAMAGALIFLL